MFIYIYIFIIEWGAKVYKSHPNQSETDVGLTNGLMVSVCYINRIKNDIYKNMDKQLPEDSKRCLRSP